ncbi:MAG TPA: PilZ domain-containing protein [Thermoanaerobaculia bacterium]|nr:PilZ domain-containing protein [Thermoanaerobaculia bacterium]
MSDERRQYQRLNLGQPIDGWFGDYAVRLIDLSASGARFECDEPLPADARALLRFFWRDEEVEVLAQIARDGAVTFVDEAPVLRDLLADAATELLRAQEANALGDRAKNVVGEETLTAASSHVSTTFITWTHSAGGWKSRVSLVPDQPENGFTIFAGEPAEQVALLCATYEGGDTESRRLTRMLAELSVASRL